MDKVAVISRCHAPPAASHFSLISSLLVVCSSRDGIVSDRKQNNKKTGFPVP